MIVSKYILKLIRILRTYVVIKIVAYLIVLSRNGLVYSGRDLSDSETLRIRRLVSTFLFSSDRFLTSTLEYLVNMHFLRLLATQSRLGWVTTSHLLYWELPWERMLAETIQKMWPELGNPLTKAWPSLLSSLV